MPRSTIVLWAKCTVARRGGICLWLALDGMVLVVLAYVTLKHANCKSDITAPASPSEISILGWMDVCLYVCMHAWHAMYACIEVGR